MLKPYKTISGRAVAAQVIERSRFIGSAAGVGNISEAVAFIEETRKKYYDATHNCYAYRTHDGRKFSDDGEPRGTAGLPISDIVEKRELTDVCIVITRYFGGVKLGAGGLVRAYSSTASLVLENAEQTEFRLFERFTAQCAYGMLSAVKAAAESCGAVLRVEYGELIALSIEIPTESALTLIQKVIETTSGAVTPARTESLLLPCRVTERQSDSNKI